MSVSPSGHVIRHTKRKAWDLNPHPREGARFSKPARPTVSGYLPYISGPTGNRTRISSMPNWCLPVGPSARFVQWTAGDRTPIAWVQTKRLPVGPAARIIKRSVRESNPVFLLTEEVCCRNTYRPFCQSDPGWSRTSSFPGCHPGVFAVGPRDHRYFSVTEVGVEPTGTRLSTSPLCQFAYPVVAGPGVAPGGPGL